MAGGKGGSGGAGGAGGGRGAGGSRGAGRGHSSGHSSGASRGKAARSASRTAARSPASRIGAAFSHVASAVKAAFNSVADRVAPKGSFAGSLLGRLATRLGVPSSVVHSRFADVAYTALTAASPALALADGLASTQKSTFAGAFSTGVAQLAASKGLPGFAARALGDLAAGQLSRAQTGLSRGALDVARSIQEGFGSVLHDATRSLGQSFASHVASKVESAVPGATQGLARAGTSVWRAAMKDGMEQVLGKQGRQTMQEELPILFGNSDMSQVTQALAGTGVPENDKEAQAINDPNAYVQQEIERFLSEFIAQMDAALR